MKKQYIFLPLILGLLYVTLQSKKNGPIAGGAGDCTTSGCGGPSCHASGSALSSPSGVMGVTLMDASATTTVSNYTPGANYTVVVYGGTLSTGLPKFGFQVEATKGTPSVDAGGTWGTLPASTHTVTASGIAVVEHTNTIAATGGSGITSYTVQIPWTAPAAGAGTVTLRAALNAVNDNNAASGDSWATGTATITESTGIGGPTTVCAGSTITLTHPTSGGTWSSSTTSVATIGATTGILTGLAAGTTTVTYNMGTSNATQVVTVNAKPVPVITSTKFTVCSTKTVAFTGTPSGGFWLSRYPSIATIGATTGIATGVSLGIDTIIYYAVNLCGADSAKKPLTVTALTSACSVGLPENTVTTEELLVYPNPNNGTFTFDMASPLNGQAYVVVTNATGAKVKDFTINTNTKQELKLNQPAGVYFITATTLTNRYYVKVIVE